MHFLCVCYYDAARFATFSPSEFAEIERICAQHDPELKASGKVRLIGSLGLPHEFKTLRADGGPAVVVDGPYDQSQSPFGAFFIVDARDIDEALTIARLHPGTHLGHLSGGGIEVRPIGLPEELLP